MVGGPIRRTAADSLRSRTARGSRRGRSELDPSDRTGRPSQGGLIGDDDEHAEAVGASTSRWVHPCEPGSALRGQPWDPSQGTVGREVRQTHRRTPVRVP